MSESDEEGLECEVLGEDGKFRIPQACQNPKCKAKWFEPSPAHPDLQNPK